MKLDLEQRDITLIAEAVVERINRVPERTQWLNRSEAAAHLRCSLSRLDELVHLGEIPVYRPSRTPLFLASELDAYVVANRREH